jgi:ribonuclease D
MSNSKKSKESEAATSHSEANTGEELKDLLQKVQEKLGEVSSDNQISPNALISLDALHLLVQLSSATLTELMENWHGPALTTDQRRRMPGSGVRRYGFIDKTKDIADENPQFVPPFLDVEQLKELIRRIEIIRNINILLRQATRVNMDFLLSTSAEAFRLSLMYYNAVREAARQRVPGAQELFNTLQQFFRSPMRKHDQPTEIEVERDAKALLKGRKEGKVVIENIAPKTIEGKRTVIDETHKAKGAWKETESGEIEE